MNTTLEDVLAAIRELSVRESSLLSPLLDRNDLAALLRVGETTLDKLRAMDKIGPAEIRIGRLVYWHRDEVNAWLATPTAKGELMGRLAWTVYRREECRRKSR
ncbi:MAG: helix-turn-helix domain-containing protein [Gemmataceae bacterium]|nr:helix-turn-helix domain-containing protein [Gemmataceae bacterium]